MRRTARGERPLLIDEWGGICLLIVRGDLDAGSIPGVKELLYPLLRERGNHVLVDVTQAEFVSCSAMSALLGFVERMRLNGGDLKICGLSGVQREIFGGLDFWGNAAFYEDRVAALLSYPKRVWQAWGVRDRRSAIDRRKTTNSYPGRNRRKHQRRRVDREASDDYSSMCAACL